MAERTAGFFTARAGGGVQCNLCRHACVISEGAAGKCGGRRNSGGALVTDFYGRVVAEHVDPVEKKPFFHVLPGSRSFSIASCGCNFRCLFCQNAEISQRMLPGRELPPEDAVAAARNAGCRSIAFTYTEPTLWLEYALRTAALAHQAGILNLFVTNGYQSGEACAAMAGLIDAANVDLKAFSDRFYRRLCGARLDGVLATIARLHALGIFLEITTLVIPGENDDPKELRELAGFIAALSPDIPWHVSRFHPAFQFLDRPATPVETLRRASAAGLEAGLKHVYVGNSPGCGYEHTRCPDCGTVVIEREGFAVTAVRLDGARCAACGRTIPLLLEGGA